MDELASPQFGYFTIRGIDYPALLTLEDSKSTLEVYSTTPLSISDEEMVEVRGIAKDGVRITAIRCIGAGISGSYWYYNQKREILSLTPNMVAAGPRHLANDAAEIDSLHFTFSNANELFYDPGTFGSLRHNPDLPYSMRREMLRAVAGSPKRRRRGGHVDVFYQWDRGPIFHCASHQFEVSAHNAPRSWLPSPAGIRIENKISILIKFRWPSKLEDAITAMFEVNDFFELVCQSRQSILEIGLGHKDAGQERSIRLYLPHQPVQSARELLPHDTLLSGGLSSDEFGEVLERWLKSGQAMRRARQRFLEGFRDSGSYTVNRLVAAANAFDVIPKNCFEARETLPPTVSKLLSSLEARVKEAEKDDAIIGEYKDQLLSLLGRTRVVSLREKILTRYRLLPSNIRGRLQGMDTVIRHSVLLRNYFVHGSSPGIQEGEVESFVSFFTDTLEFIFATSDLTCCGWNAERWSTQSFSRSRLKWYMNSFEGQYSRLRKAIRTR